MDADQEVQIADYFETQTITKAGGEYYKLRDWIRQEIQSAILAERERCVKIVSLEGCQHDNEYRAKNCIACDIVAEINGCRGPQPPIETEEQARIRLAILAEREACAAICDSKGKNPHDYTDGFLGAGDAYADLIRARSNAPETEKEITVKMPPKSRQAGMFTINDYQTLDPGEIIAPDPVSV